MINKAISQQQLKALCDAMANSDPQCGLTESEIRLKLGQCSIVILDKGNRNNGYTYQLGLNKRDWLYNCFVNEINTKKSYVNIYRFVENALDPVNFTSEEKRSKYQFLFCETNKVLLLNGLEVRENGKITETIKAETLDDVDKRVKSLEQKLNDRNIHEEVKKYCIKDYLRKDYFDAVFEAAKGVAQRVRNITGLATDGGTLFQTAFSKKDPYLYFNLLQTESEISEFTGLKELLESIFHLVRNSQAHTPKINWPVSEEKALDILTLISVAHKYLDECKPVPYKVGKEEV
ncbi:MAG: TIGR02391 family protein [Oscillospiraceae bacterium]